MIGFFSYNQEVSWTPPRKFRGKPTGYIIKAVLIFDDTALLKLRNYCENREQILFLSLYFCVVAF